MVTIRAWWRLSVMGLVCVLVGLSSVQGAALDIGSGSTDSHDGLPRALPTYVTLTLPMLEVADGIVITSDILEKIYTFKREILSIMRGDRSLEAGFVGRYVCNNKKMTVQELLVVERGLNAQDDVIKKELAHCLSTMRRDLYTAAEKLRIVTGGAKSLLGELIAESCRKRNSMQSLLLVWVDVSEQDELNVFEQRVTTIETFAVLCVDMLNFIGDFVQSCPKAQRQFDERMKKWQQFEMILKNVLGTAKPDMKFLQYVKIQYLDKLSYEDITLSTIRHLLDEFDKTNRA